MATKWTYTLRLKDVFHDEERTYEQRLAVIVRRIKAMPAYRRAEKAAEEGDEVVSGEQLELINLVDEMKDAKPDDFDDVWSAFYDWADFNKIWVETR